MFVAERRLVLRLSMQSKGSAIVGTRTSLCVLIYTLVSVQWFCWTVAKARSCDQNAKQCY